MVGASRSLIDHIVAIAAWKPTESIADAMLMDSSGSVGLSRAVWHALRKTSRALGSGVRISLLTSRCPSCSTIALLRGSVDARPWHARWVMCAFAIPLSTAMRVASELRRTDVLATEWTTVLTLSSSSVTFGMDGYPGASGWPTRRMLLGDSSAGDAPSVKRLDNVGV